MAPDAVIAKSVRGRAVSKNIARLLHDYLPLK
jgi:hypothetical protein